MQLVDLLLNLTGLALWLGMLAGGTVRFPPAARKPLLTPAHAPSPRRLSLGVLLLVLLAIRPFVYWHVGRDMNWVAELDLGALRLPFNSASLPRMAFFSTASFALLLGGFYLWLILLSVLNRDPTDSSPWRRIIESQLGWIGRWPWPLRLALAPLVIVCLWWAAAPALAQAGMVPPPRSATHVWQQGLLLAASSALAWKYLVAGMLFVHFLNSYLYLGNRPWLAYANRTACACLRPLRRLPLRAGRVDFTPVVGLALTFGLFDLLRRLLGLLFNRLPL
jgi:uncharacterized protein YggT (Ycf19 family)